MKALVCAIVTCLMLAIVAKGHTGGLDNLGCHNDRRWKYYHCHEGPLAGRTFHSKAEAKKEWDRQRIPRPEKKKGKK